MFSQVRDAIKYGLVFLIFLSLPGKAQQGYDSLQVSLPDTSLSIGNTLILLEQGTELYFSYNPGIFPADSTMEWAAGEYLLGEILDRICGINQVERTLVGNQIVLHPAGEAPASHDQLATDLLMPQILTIKGRVFGESEKDPLAYSTVWLPSTWEGTIANADGYFAFKVPVEWNADTIAVSCMGYETLLIPIAELSDSLNTIILPQSLIPIQEVVIRRTNPVYLLRLALSRIPDNNSRRPVVETAFYRETIQKNNNYISVSEAVVDVFKPGYESLSIEQIKLRRGRKNIDYTEADTLMVKLKAGLETSFLLDVIRNRPDFLQEESFYRYRYHMSDIVVFQENLAYAIDFTQKPETDPPHYLGRIYIDLNTFAIRAVEFEVDPGTIASMAGSMVVRKPRKARVRPLSASYQVRYKAEEGLYHVSLIRAENRFRIRPHKKLFGNEIRTVSEMAVTGLQTENVERFRIRESVNPREVFTDMLGGYDPAFWGPYNYIIPEESLEEALTRISRLMKKPPVRH